MFERSYFRYLERDDAHRLRWLRVLADKITGYIKEAD